MALQGFDKDFYLNAKLAQVRGQFPEWNTKTVAELETYMANVGLTPEQHYVQYGWQEGLSPNAWFNGEEYTLFKAQSLFATNEYISLEAAREAFLSAWTGNVYDHYLAYGCHEGENGVGLNPSNNFDSSLYLAAKLEQLKATDAAKYGDWTVKEVADAFADAGLSPIEHFMKYGMAEGINVELVPADEQVNPANTGVEGETFTLTDQIDVFAGTTANDTFIGDNATTSSADQIDGGLGEDTFMLYGGGPTLPALSNVENLWIDGNGGNRNIASSNDIKNITFNGLGINNANVTLGADDSFGLANADDASLNTVNINLGATDSNLLVYLNNAGNQNMQTLNLAGAAALSSITTELSGFNMVTLGNNANVLEEMTVTGSGAAAFSVASNQLKSIDAHTNTGGVTLMGNAPDVDFTFKGGSGFDSVSFAATQLDTHDVLTGGDGMDTLGIADTAVTAASADLVAAINATNGFEALSLNATAGANAVDFNVIQGSGIHNVVINHATPTNTITNTVNDSVVTVAAGIQNNNAASISNVLGENNVKLVMEAVDGAAGQSELGALSLNGVMNVAIESNFVGRNTQANANVVTLAAAVENSTYTITGNQNLNLQLVAGAATLGSTVDAKDFNAELQVSGTNMADRIIGSAKNDTITGSDGMDVLTGGAGDDTFDMSAATILDLANMSTITDAEAGDSIKFLAAANAFTAAKIDVSTAANLAAAVGLADATANAVTWFQYGGDTYLVAAGATASATTDDEVVKLTGTIDLTDADFTVGTQTLELA